MSGRLRGARVNTSLAIDDLACARGGRRLFTGVSASLLPGQLLWVRGDNGAGKTSLLRIVCGLLTPTQGRVSWRGRAVGAASGVGLGWGGGALGGELLHLGHASALKDDLNATENLQSACVLAGLPEPGAVEARSALREAGLKGCEAWPARRLSQGQRRRCALARLVLSPGARLWVLDEPFESLDATASEWLHQLLRQHLARGGNAVLTSHLPLRLDATLAQELPL